MKNKLIIFAIVTGCLVIIAEGVILYATNLTIGVSPDTFTYIKVARNIISGQGLIIAPGSPLTHYPPLYPAFLALSGLVGFDPLDGAKWFHVFLSAANILLVTTIIYRETNGSIMASAFGSLFMISSLPMLFISQMAYSETLFILMTLSGFFILAEYLSDQENFALLAISSLFIGFGCLTRYVGVSGVVSASVSVLLLRNCKISQKIKYACIYGIISSLPMIFWLVRNRLVTDNLANRTVQYHPIGPNHIDQGITAVAEWLLLPENLSSPAKSTFVAVFIFLLVAGSFLLYLKQKRTINSLPATNISYFPIISIIFMGGYLLTLIFSISFFDAHTPLDNRILSPLFPLITILFFSLVFNGIFSLRIVPLNFLLVLIFASLITYQTKTTLPYLHYMHENGIGLTNKQWQTSRILKIVELLPDNIVLYSNSYELIELLTHKKASMIPAVENPGTVKKNKEFDSQLQAMVKKLEESDGLLVYFNVTGRWYLPTSEYLSDNLPLHLLYEGQDGKIYQFQKKASG